MLACYRTVLFGLSAPATSQQACLKSDQGLQGAPEDHLQHRGYNPGATTGPHNSLQFPLGPQHQHWGHAGQGLAPWLDVVGRTWRNIEGVEPAWLRKVILVQAQQP